MAIPFKDMLRKISAEGSEKVQAFYIQEETPSEWDEKVHDGYLFDKEGTGFHQRL